MHRHNFLGLRPLGPWEGSKNIFLDMVMWIIKLKGMSRIHRTILTYDQIGDLGMGSKGQLPLDFFESVGICDGATPNVF